MLKEVGTADINMVWLVNIKYKGLKVFVLLTIFIQF